jgi:type 1 glutamine amidotransferase
MLYSRLQKLLSGLLLVGLSAPALRAADPKPAAPMRVCILSGCPTYNSEKSLPPFQKWLESNYNVTCDRLVRKADDDLPGLEKLDACDVALVFFKRMNLKGEQLERFQKYVTSGRPVVGVRTASHAVQTWLAFDREVLGGNYNSHYGKEPVEIEVTDAGKKHSILAGVELTAAPGPLYKNAGHAKDITVLLTGTIPGHTEPLAWTRDYKGGRVFYTSLGDEKTFEQEPFRRMLAQALYWTAKRDVAKK